MKSYLTKNQIIEIVKGRKLDFDTHKFDYFLKRGLLMKREGVGTGAQQHQSLFNRANIDIIEAILRAKQSGKESMKSIIKRFKNAREYMESESGSGKLAKLCNVDFHEYRYSIVWSKTDIAYVVWENVNEYSEPKILCKINGLKYDRLTEQLLNVENAVLLGRKETDSASFDISIDNERVRRENTPIKEDIYFIEYFYENIDNEHELPKWMQEG
jgi:hypothetical protein